MPATVKQQWDSFFEQVIPPTAGAAQLQETRRAFYAGAWAMFCLIAASEADEAPPEQWAAYLEGLRKECMGFNEAILDGKA